MKDKFWRFLSCALTLTVMVLIFVFSSRDSSDSTIDSARVTHLICRVTFFGYSGYTAEKQKLLLTALQPFVRKLAHFSIYFALGFFSYAAVSSSDGRKFPRWIGALIFCFCYAGLDEIHQYFVPGRAMRFTDVMLDTCGAAVGMLALRVLVLLAEDAVRQYKKKDKGYSP